MKKINKFIYVIILALAFVFTISCNDIPDEPVGPKEKVDIIAPTENMSNVENYLLNNISHKIVSNDYTLPTKVEGYDNISITWESLEPEIIADNGNIVVRPKKITEITYSYCLEDENSRYYNEMVFEIYPKTFDAVANQFELQFNCNISDDFDVNTIFEKVYNVTWTSSNQDVFTNKGEYTKPEEDTEIVICFRVFLDDLTYQDFTCKAVIACMSDIERVRASIDWLNNTKIKDLDVRSNLELPTKSELGADISWVIYNNTEIMEKDGTIHPTVYDRYVQALATVSYNSGKETYTYLFKIVAKDISEMSEKEVLEEFLDTIGRKEIGQVNFLRYSKISNSFNFIDFFDNVYTKQIEQLAPSPANNVPGKKQTEIKFVCVHDTANNNAGAKAHADYVEEGGGGTSFHYVVGNDGIYHLVENGYVAYHAGDGTQYNYKLYDTGVKFNGSTHPIQAISEDGYFTINGEKTTIKIPEGAINVSKLCTTGVYMEVLPNGNYGMNENYYNTTYCYIANRGGNNNSIGIETCVNAGSDYFITVRNNIDLVSYLCTTYDLPVDQVLQHNSFSGKPCPDAIRWANYWQAFRDYVSMEKFGMEHFQGLTFKWTPTSNGINKSGYIQKNVTDIDQVSYSVEVLKGDQIFVSKSYTTKLVK